MFSKLVESQMALMIAEAPLFPDELPWSSKYRKVLFDRKAGAEFSMSSESIPHPSRYSSLGGGIRRQITPQGPLRLLPSTPNYWIRDQELLIPSNSARPL